MRINEKPESGAAFHNPLAHTSSPYLRQHSKNPVFWHPWGEKALALAKAEDKPILLSVGYSTCYWCHVMEREVFENLSIASVMNKYFINIKVDREEHPQIDELYMVARQLMTHEGGWPNHVFLTPDLKPFYAGGTYGATDAYNKPSFPRLLEWLSAQWNDQRKDVELAAQRTIETMTEFLVAKPAEKTSDFSPMIADARANLAKRHDITSGGFFQAPKFPQENYLQFLLAHHEATGDAQSLEMAAFTLRKMAAGGINDHVGCGFHRYAVDKDWMVPHFEKMLYTQALLARCYTDAARLTGSDYLTDVARSICEFTAGPFTDGRGAFYAAIDAETDGCEGAYYAWTTEELQKILTSDEVDFFIHHYGLAAIPHFAGHKHPDGEVVLLRAPLDELAAGQKIPYGELSRLSGIIMNKLLGHRNLHRVAPRLDHKIIVGWNGLMIDALSHAGLVFGIKDYVTRAYKAADYLLTHAIDDNGHLVRCVTHGKAEHLATLEDYAYLIKGLLSLHKAIQEDDMLLAAMQLMNTAEGLFEDAQHGGFFSMQEKDALPIRIKNGDDSALPNANAVMAGNYLTLYEITGDAAWQEKAQKMLQLFLSGEKIWLEYTSMLTYAMRAQQRIDVSALPAASSEEKIVTIETSIALLRDQFAEVVITLTIKDGWYIQPTAQHQMDGTATRVMIQGEGVRVMEAVFPEPGHSPSGKIYKGSVAIHAQVALPGSFESRPEIRVMVQYHPCSEHGCHAAVNDVVAV